jgi:hypothetical protein
MKLLLNSQTLEASGLKPMQAGENFTNHALSTHGRE